jgi:hypothetical protein
MPPRMNGANGFDVCWPCRIIRHTMEAFFTLWPVLAMYIGMVVLFAKAHPCAAFTTRSKGEADQSDDPRRSSLFTTHNCS